MVVFWFVFFKQKTAYEVRISDWSSDVCSSDLDRVELASRRGLRGADPGLGRPEADGWVVVAVLPDLAPRVEAAEHGELVGARGVGQVQAGSPPKIGRAS